MFCCGKQGDITIICARYCITYHHHQLYFFISSQVREIDILIFSVFPKIKLKPKYDLCKCLSLQRFLHNIREKCRRHGHNLWYSYAAPDYAYSVFQPELTNGLRCLDLMIIIEHMACRAFLVEPLSPSQFMTHYALSSRQRPVRSSTSCLALYSPKC